MIDIEKYLNILECVNMQLDEDEREAFETYFHFFVYPLHHVWLWKLIYVQPHIYLKKTVFISIIINIKIMLIINFYLFLNESYLLFLL